MVSVKEQFQIPEVQELLQVFFGDCVESLAAVKGGNLKSVYFFKFQNKDYVIRFSKDNTEFKVEEFLYKLFIRDHISMAKTIRVGSFKDFFFSISERISGLTMKELKEWQVRDVFPDLVKVITNMHFTDISATNGYGWIRENGNGNFNSLRQFLEDFFQRKQKGFWEDWHELFENSFLEYNSFTDLYGEMINLSKYCEGKRYLVHGDLHFGNILSNGHRISGLIDWGNAMYGDFVFDIASVNMQFPQYGFSDIFEEHYKREKIQVENFKERFLCASLCKGLDTLRFSAKLGWRDSYNSVLKYLHDLLK